MGTAVLLTSGRIRLFLATALFLCWIGWLAVTALTKSRAPTVSRAQAAAATVAVVADLEAGKVDRESVVIRLGPNQGQMVDVLKEEADKPAFVVAVVESLTPGGPEAGKKLGVVNLSKAAGYSGPGPYLLLLNKDPSDGLMNGQPLYILVGQQRSPGADLDGVGPPMIYPWTDKTRDDLRAQVKHLFPPKN